MQIVQKTVELNTRDYYITHLKLISPIVGIELTPKELLFLSEFLAQPEELKSLGIFNSKSRKVIKEVLGLSNANLSNYLTALRNKKVLYYDTALEIYKVNASLLPDDREQGYRFKLVNNGL